MAEYSDHSSLYENSDYPSRRQAPSRRASSGGSRQAPDAPKKRRRKKKKGGITVGRVVGWVSKTIGTLILIGLCTGALLACFAAVYINEVIVPIADLSPDDFVWNEDSIMYYQDKTTGQYVEMTKLNNITSSVWVDYDEIPEDLINAAVAIEDKRFWTHPGVDWRRTAYAVYSMFTGKEISGGSTITQQLLKNTTQYNETTVKRKITEIIRALRFTQNNSKEDTLMYYLNVIPLGSKYKGVGSAALGYFGKPVSELTLAECASLIGITNNPSKYGPYSFSRSQGFNTDEIWSARQWNKYRQEVILNQMLEQHYITREEYDEAVAQELVFVKEQGGSNDELYSWYEETVISDVKEIMAEQYGWSSTITEQAMQRGGLRIYTCYDPAAQAIVDEIYTNRDNLDYTSKDGQQMQSTIAVIENDTGNLVAIAGQFGEKTVPFGSNYANDGHRQPGFSFKPLAVYSPAIEMGLITPASVVDDSPQLLNGRPWPYNVFPVYDGLTTVWDGLTESLNTVAVRVLEKVTPQASFDFLEQKYGITTLVDSYVDSGGQTHSDIDRSPLAMGGLTRGVTTFEMAAAYASFPRNGEFVKATTVLEIKDSSGNVIRDNRPEPSWPFSQKTAYYMNSMLTNVVNAGTGYLAKIPGQTVAGKTGTTNDVFNYWFCGYTSYYTAAVWTGYRYNEKINSNYVNPSVTMWQKVMAILHEGKENAPFPVPGELGTYDICKDCGKRAVSNCANDSRGNRVQSFRLLREDAPAES